MLELTDDDGMVILAFEEAISSLTPSDLAALSEGFDAQGARIDSLEERLGNIRIGTLRDRIKELEGQVSELRRQLQTLRTAGSTNPRVSFRAEERILLEGIPNAIRKTCSPRRSDNPTGTIAAVQCKPDTPVVRDMAYYLMPAGAASTVFQQRMDQNGVKDGPGQCRNGASDVTYDTPGPGAVGCYVNADDRANIRVVEAASGCSQLRVGDRTLRIPAIYVAVLGHDDDIRGLARWAEPRPGRSIVTQEVRRPNAPISPRCPT